MTTAIGLAANSAYKKQYDQEGVLVVRSLFSAEEMKEALAESKRIFKDYEHLKSIKNLRCRWQDNVFTGVCTFETFDPVIDLSPMCERLSSHPALLAVLNQLYGEPACLFKDKLIYKPPGVKGYRLHQDWISWDGFPRSFLTVLIPIDPVDSDNGCTVVYPGYHQLGPLTQMDGTYHELPMSTVDESKEVALVLEPGDVAIFSGFTPHRSDPNLSDRWRRQLYLSYNASSDGGKQRNKHYQEFHGWLKEKYADYGKTDTYFE